MKLRTDLAGLPPYVPGRNKPGAVKMASNENPLGPSPKALEAVRAAVAKVHIYPDGSSKLLREAIARTHGVSPEQILTGNGLDEVFGLIAGAYVSPGDNAVISEHTFSEYAFSVRLFGGALKIARMKNYTYDLDAILALVDAKTKIVFLCNPNNPTGTYFDHDRLTAFLDALSEDVLVVLDEAYAHFADASDFPRSFELLKTYPNLVVCRTFSKIFGLAAMRIGYMVGRESVVRDVSVVKQPFNMSSLAQAAAAAAIDDVEFVQKSYTMNQVGRRYLTAELTHRGFLVLPSQANFIAVSLETEAKAFFEHMMDEGITIRPLASFGLPTWIRVTVDTAEHNELFLRLFDRVMGRKTT